MWFWIGFVTALVIMSAFLFWPGKGSKDSRNKGPYELQASKQIGDTKAAQTFLSSSNTGTIQAFIYPLAFQRTGQLSMCSDGTTPQPGEPNCSSGRFGICACAGTDCTQCKHVGYVNLLNVSNVLRLEMLSSPDASRRNAALVQLVVRTLRRKSTSATTEVVEETIALPNLPIQRWTMITIAREGRRYDVYYNASLVSSKRSEYVLDSFSAIGPIVSGDPNLYGSVADIQIFAQRLTAADVSRLYSTLADTNGEPYASKKDLNLMDYMPFCKGGSCITGPSVRPSSPLLDWDTQYA